MKVAAHLLRLEPDLVGARPPEVISRGHDTRERESSKMPAGLNFHPAQKTENSHSQYSLYFVIVTKKIRATIFVDLQLIGCKPTNKPKVALSLREIFLVKRWYVSMVAAHGWVESNKGY
jgi:hypothetical protein